MKFRRSIFLVIILLVVLAWFTKPGLEDFHKFYEDELRTDTPPLIDLSDRFLYTSVTVSYFSIARLNPGEEKKAITGRKDEYLGLFGRFWKL